MILIAPPVGALDYPDRQIPDLQVKIVVGDGDDFIDLAKLTAWAERVGVPAPTLISGADHFFASQGDALTAALRGFAD